MEVVVDTNVIMDAVFDQLDKEDCWEILMLIRKKEITLAMSRQLKMEYFFIPSRIAIRMLEEKFNDGKLTHALFKQVDSLVYDCMDKLSTIVDPNCRSVEVTSALKICTEDPSDDKLVNLAIDANCEIIITENIRHLREVENQKIKNRSGQRIKVMTAGNFLIYHKLSGQYKVRNF